MGRLRRAVEPSRAGAAACAVTAWLMREVDQREPQRVAIYAALPDELPTRPLFEALRTRGFLPLLPRSGRRQLEFVPARRWEDLRRGSYGVLESPSGVAPERLSRGDLVVVPCVAFDRSGHRLGRGGGSYDRTFGTAAAAPLLIGAGYAFQLGARVPHESRDRVLDAIVTECGFVWPRRR